MQWLNTTETFPVNADNPHLIEQFENLNDITITVFHFEVRQQLSKFGTLNFEKI